VPFAGHLPPVPLRPYIAVAQGYRVPAMPTGLHRGLPSRHLTFVVELLGPLRVAHGGTSVVSHAVVGGLHTGPAWIDASVPQEGVQYGMTPLAARTLLGVPAAELAGRTVPLGALLGPGAGEVVERMVAASTWPERFARLDDALLRRLATCRDVAPVPSEVAEAWRMLLATDGRVRVADLAAHVGWGRRHLSECFRLATGLTPKQAARIARFESARHLLGQPQSPALADVADRCGYADQSHLAREWRALAGCSAGTWLREELPFVQDANSPEPAHFLT
jgi:AraC-like DNA-binding protein